MKRPLYISQVSVFSNFHQFQTAYEVHVAVTDYMPVLAANWDSEAIVPASDFPTEVEVAVAKFTLSNEVLYSCEKKALLELFADVLQAELGFGSKNEWIKVIKGNTSLNPDVGFEFSNQTTLLSGGVVYAPPALASSWDSSQLSKSSNLLPGLFSKVECPCDLCWSSIDGAKLTPLKLVIIHLNDQMKWSREQIADWLDELHESGAVDLEFKVEE